MDYLLVGLLIFSILTLIVTYIKDKEYQKNYKIEMKELRKGDRQYLFVNK